jgi:hypothetical protein
MLASQPGDRGFLEPLMIAGGTPGDLASDF